VRRHGEEVDVHRLHVERELADPLGGVGVEEDALLARHLSISPIGLMVPISLLANMMETSSVLSVIALRTSSGSTSPYLSTGR